MKNKTPYLVASVTFIIVGWFSYMATLSILETVPPTAKTEKIILATVLTLLSSGWSVIIAALIYKTTRRYINKNQDKP